jgi:ribosomal protein L16 Arg81 hydroxylase
MTFEELVAPSEADRFWSEAWERRSAHISGRAADHYDPIATARDIEELLFGSVSLPADAVKLYRGAEETACDATLERSYQQGHTIVVASVDRFLPRLAAQLASFEARFKAKCVAHLVASPAGAEGLPPHSDAYGVFALQIAGAKTWSLYEDGPRATVNHGIDQHQLIGAPPSSRIRMEAGDLLYLPRGTIHAGATTDDRSLHLAVAIIPPRGADALSLLCGVAESDPFFRDYMPYGIGETPEKRADYAEAFRARLLALLGRTDIFALLDRRRADRAAAAKKGENR